MKRPLSRRWIGFGIALFVALMAALVFLFHALLPLFWAFGLAYACSPLVDWLEKKKVPRAMSAIGLLIVLAGILTGVTLLLVPVIADEVRAFIAGFPDFLESALGRIGELAGRFGVVLPVNQQELMAHFRHTLQGANAATVSPAVDVAKDVLAGVGVTLLSALNLLIVPVFFFYFLKDLPGTRRYAFNLIPLKYRPLGKRLFQEADRVLAGYIRGQFAVALILSIIYGIALPIIGIKFALFIGLMTGLLSLIPYLGQITGFALSMTMALVEFRGVGPLIAVALLFLVVGAVEGNIITPRIVGDRVGLSPVWTIISLIIAGEIGGITTLIIAIPVAGVIKVILKEFLTWYRRTPFFVEAAETKAPMPAAH